MKKEILDTPFRDSFEDFLHKDESIQWEKTIDEDIQIPIILNDEGTLRFNLGKLLSELLLATGLAVFLFYVAYPSPNMTMLILPYLFIIITLPRNHKIYGTKIHPTKYAITTKRVLFRLSHLPKNEIHDITFSQIINCNVMIEEGKSGTIFLTVKNSAPISFKTFTYFDNNKVWRYQPTLESIDEAHLVAQLIQNGIKNKSL